MTEKPNPPPEPVRPTKRLTEPALPPVCPQCSGPTINRKCKLICPRCGYFESCSDLI